MEYYTATKKEEVALLEPRVSWAKWLGVWALDWLFGLVIWIKVSILPHFLAVPCSFASLCLTSSP